MADASVCKSVSHGSCNTYHGISALSTAFISEQPSTTTLSCAVPILTLTPTLYSSLVQPTLTASTTKVSSSSTILRSFISLAPVRSSTLEYTAIVSISETTTTPTTVSVPPFSVGIGNITSDNVTTVPQFDSEILLVPQATDNLRNDENLQPTVQIVQETLQNPICELVDSNSGQGCSLHQNESESYSSEFRASSEYLYSLGFSQLAEAPYEELEELNPTRLETAFTLKRTWNLSEISDLDSDSSRLWKRLRRTATEPPRMILDTTQNSKEQKRQNQKSHVIPLGNQLNKKNKKNSLSGLELLVSTLLCILMPKDGSEPKQRRHMTLRSLGSGSKAHVRQPPPERPISQDQLIAEVKGIYAGLVMVEGRCIEVDARQNRPCKLQPKLTNEQWQALIALHRTLLHEHHDFFLASLHPSAAPALRRLAMKYAMPSRLWRHGIYSFLQLLKHQPPYSMSHMRSFISLASSMMNLPCEKDLTFEDSLTGYSRDLCQYRIAAIDDDIRDRQVWKEVARYWYSKTSRIKPTNDWIYHHLENWYGVVPKSHDWSLKRISLLACHGAKSQSQICYDPTKAKSSTSHGLETCSEDEIETATEDIDQFIEWDDNWTDNSSLSESLPQLDPRQVYKYEPLYQFDPLISGFEIVPMEITELGSEFESRMLRSTHSLPSFPNDLEDKESYLDELPFAQSSQFWDIFQGALSDYDSSSSDALSADNFAVSSETQVHPALNQMHSKIDNVANVHLTACFQDVLPIQPVEATEIEHSIAYSVISPPHFGNYLYNNNVEDFTNTILSPLDHTNGDQNINSMHYNQFHNTTPIDLISKTSPSALPLPPAGTPASPENLYCLSCMRFFHRRCDFNKHIATHTRPYACTAADCAQSFPTRKDRDRHLGDRHSESLERERIKCKHADCAGKGVSFKRKDNRNKHWRRMHGRNPTADEV